MLDDFHGSTASAALVGATEISAPRRPPSPVLVAPNVMDLVGAYLRDRRHDQLGVFLEKMKMLVEQHKFRSV
jgi:hypothetical protein